MVEAMPMVQIVPSSRLRLLPARSQHILVTCRSEHGPGGSGTPGGELLATASKGQLLRAQLQGSPTPLWLETVAVKQGGVEVLCEGELVRLSLDGGGRVAARHVGHWPRFADAWVKQCPSLQASLQRLRQEQAGSAAGLPSLQLAGLAGLTPATSLQQLRLDVGAHPGLWCDGAGPGDAALTEEQQQLLTAGELVAFMAGLRGVVMVQLLKGWGDTGTARQPLLRAYVLTLLAAAAADKGVLLLPSSAAGGLGASLVLCPKQQPFRAWAEHLAGLGVQSSLVADSSYYKLLIGRILGYTIPNCVHHIESSGGAVDAAVMRAVEEQLAALSSAAPTLPWTSKRARK